MTQHNLLRFFVGRLLGLFFFLLKPFSSIRILFFLMDNYICCFFSSLSNKTKKINDVYYDCTDEYTWSEPVQCILLFIRFLLIIYNRKYDCCKFGHLFLSNFLFIYENCFSIEMLLYAAKKIYPVE